MEGSYNDITLTNPDTEEPKIVKTDIGSKDGQDKCPKCGGTDISTNINTGRLRCNFCRHEFDPIRITGMVENLNELKGEVIASGATDIVADTKDVLTFKCESCGAEVVIDTSDVSQARCHWCRNTLSVNNQIPNGAIPDAVLPFSVTKDVAKAQIEKFVGKRKFFANTKFKKEFTTDNIMGVYFPYMIVDANAHMNLSGKGEHQTRRYTIDDTTYYDAEVFHVEREFDILIDGLSIESNSERLDKTRDDKTNNIINAIMPFDTENCVKYNANYLKGYTSERRDTNIDELKSTVHNQFGNIAKFAANDTLKSYDRGVCWEKENLVVKGEQWQAAYLPVWLYSYQEVKGNKKVLHYVAVNARTKETMGSIPIHMPKLIGVSALVEILAIFLMSNIDSEYSWIFLLSGFIYFMAMYVRYRNSSARHTYEKETKNKVSNMRKIDAYIQTKTKLTNRRIKGANNNLLSGIGTITNDKSLINSIPENIALGDLIKRNINKGGKL